MAGFSASATHLFYHKRAFEIICHFTASSPFTGASGVFLCGFTRVLRLSLSPQSVLLREKLFLPPLHVHFKVSAIDCTEWCLLPNKCVSDCLICSVMDVG